MIFWMRQKRRHRRGTIALLAALLVGSALLRLSAGATQAIAQVGSEITTAETRQEPQPTSLPMSRDVTSRGEIRDLLEALRAREMQVEAREKQIEMRSKALAVADAEITRRIAALEETEANLRRTLALAKGAAENDLARLTAVYENMKPKEAAALFEAMEPDFAAGFLGRMRPDTAAAVMARLSPEAAYSISVILAGRNANAPES